MFEMAHLWDSISVFVLLFPPFPLQSDRMNTSNGMGVCGVCAQVNILLLLLPLLTIPSCDSQKIPLISVLLWAVAYVMHCPSRVCTWNSMQTWLTHAVMQERSEGLHMRGSVMISSAHNGEGFCIALDLAHRPWFGESCSTSSCDSVWSSIQKNEGTLWVYWMHCFRNCLYIEPNEPCVCGFFVCFFVRVWGLGAAAEKTVSQVSTKTNVRYYWGTQMCHLHWFQEVWQADMEESSLLSIVSSHLGI